MTGTGLRAILPGHALRFVSRLTKDELGKADLLIVGDGARVTYFEVKTPTGKLSEAQTKMHAILRRKGCTVHVVTDSLEALRLVMGAPGLRKCGT